MKLEEALQEVVRKYEAENGTPYPSPHYVLLSLLWAQRLPFDVEEYIAAHADDVFTMVSGWQEFITPYEAKKRLIEVTRR